jgi:hypothetical protein
VTKYASAARIDSVFARAKEKVSIEDYLKRESVKLVRSGKQMRGPCILCDGGTSKFKVEGERFYCFGCERHGDVVQLVAEHRKCEPYDAARWLVGEDVPVSAPAARKPAAPVGPSVSDKVAAEILADAKPFAGSLAERYLLGRGIHPEVVELAAANLRYHGSAKHHWDDAGGHWVRAPAMVAPVVTHEGPTGGVHVTYLDRASGGKAGFSRSKLMWGAQMRNGLPGGAWLIGPLDCAGLGTDLVVGEGIETSLSVATMAWRKGLGIRAAAALSLNRLQGGLHRDADGCVDPWRPIGDPASPAFTWPSPPQDPWGEVLIAVDRDMSDIRVRARSGRGKAVDMRLTAEVRARVCGRLAVAAWKGAGAHHARAIVPPPCSDFNDELRRVLALEHQA